MRDSARHGVVAHRARIRHARWWHNISKGHAWHASWWSRHRGPFIYRRYARMMKAMGV